MQSYWFTGAKALCFMDTWALRIPGTIIRFWNIKKKSKNKKKKHHQLHRNPWAPWNPCAWQEIELLFFSGVSLVALRLGSTHEQDPHGFGAVMWWNENQLWSDAEAEEGLRKRHNAKMEYQKNVNLHPTSCFLNGRHSVVMTALLPLVVPKNRGHLPIALLLIW